MSSARRSYLWICFQSTFLNLFQENSTPVPIKTPTVGMLNHARTNKVPGGNSVVTHVQNVVGLNNGLSQNRAVSPAASVNMTSGSHSPIIPHRTIVTNKTSGVSPPRSVPGSVAISSGATVARTFVNTTVGNLSFSKSAGNAVRPSGVVSTAGKQQLSTLTSFQGKKPIPIKPKNPTLMPGSSLQTAGNVPGTMLKGLPVLAPTAAVSQGQVRQPTTVAATHGQLNLNGIDMSGRNLANAQTQNVFPASSQHILTTSAKRIAPKHQTILPQQTVMSSQQIPVQSPGTVTLQKVLVPQMSTGISPQSQNTLSHISSATIQHNQDIPTQQLLNVIQQGSVQQGVTQHVTQGVTQHVRQGVTQHVTQSQQVAGNEVKHIQQIEQLVHQKLPNLQQSQVVQTTQPQTSNQPQSLAYQQQVLKQLIIQAQQPKAVQATQQVQQQPQQQQQQTKQGLQQHVLVKQQVGLPLQQQKQEQQLTVQVSPQVQKRVLAPNPGTPVSVQLQHLVDQQQKHLQQILGPQQQPQQQPQPQQKISTTQGQQQHVYQQQVVQGGKVLTSTIQQVTPAQLQQLQLQQQNSSGVQKVLIIKQPELLQKLGLQAGKTQQTIQITQQQLETLKQLQLQQQHQTQPSTQQGTQQKVFVMSKAQSGTSQPQVLTMEQVKQLQQQGLQIRQVQVQGQSKQQQPLLQQQRQVLTQQLQKQLQPTVKSQSKMQHIPRILQTSGRQPVTSTKVSS